MRVPMRHPHVPLALPRGVRRATRHDTTVASSALLMQREIGPSDVAALACVLGAIALVVRRPAAPPAAEETQRQTS